MSRQRRACTAAVVMILTATTVAFAVGISPAWAAERVDVCAEASYHAGFRDAELVTAVAVGMAESTCNPAASNPRADPGTCSQSTDRGLFQINSCDHDLVSDQCAYRADCNAEAAFDISAEGTRWSPWGSYTSGAYRRFVEMARAAVQRLPIPPPLPMRPTCRAVAGDWNGDGSETIGVACRETGNQLAWYLRDSNTGGGPDISSRYGNANSCLPITGDWDGDGRTSIGLACREGINIRWSLNNTFSGSSSYPTFVFGNANACWPVTGDWDGNGTDTVGVACPSSNNAISWELMNVHSGGTPQLRGSYGSVGSCRPVAGDWNRDGRDTVGVACQDGITIRWSLVNELHGSPSYPVFGFGNANSCQPVTGDWNASGATRVGIACIGTTSLSWELKTVHAGGAAGFQMNYGNTTAYQPTGGWGGPAWPAWPTW